MKNKFFRDMKIGNKLMLSYLLACIIPLLAVSAIIYKVSAENLEEASLEFASVFSSQIVTNIDDFIEEYDRVTKSVLVDNDLIYSLEDSLNKTVSEQVSQQLDMRKIMMRLMTLKPEIKSIILLTEEGRLYQFSSDGAYADAKILKEQKWLDQIRLAKDKLTITAVHDRPYYDRNQDGIVLTVGRQILNYGGAYVGVLLIDLEPSSLIELSDGFLLARNNYNIKISITDADNGILYDSDVASGRLTWEEAREAENPLLYEKKEKDFLVLTNETKRAGLKVNAVIPRSDLLFKINKIGYVTAAAVLICMLVVIAVSLLFSRTITRPIRKLQKHMGQVEEGQYKVIPEKESCDEIGDLVISYNHMVMKIKTLIEDVYMAEIKEKNAKYLALQTQINPHMLYNTLESIRMKALVNGEDEIADMIKILAKMFRMALSNQTDSHRIQDELDYAENYLKLQNMRFKNLFSLEVEVEPRIRQALIISLVLQPVIENCIEHGLRGQGIPLRIMVHGQAMENGDIMLIVRDDGRGMSQERIDAVNNRLSRAESDKLTFDHKQDEGKTSIGLKNIAERIKLHYGERYYLKVIDSGDEGTTIAVCIPGQWRQEETSEEEGE